MSRRAEQARGAAFLDPLQTTVEAEIEIEPRLLPVRDDVETGRDLVVHGRDDGVLLQLGDVVWAELVQSPCCVFEPAREGVASDHRRSQWRHCRILAP